MITKVIWSPSNELRIFSNQNFRLACLSSFEMNQNFNMEIVDILLKQCVKQDNQNLKIKTSEYPHFIDMGLGLQQKCPCDIVICTGRILMKNDCSSQLPNCGGGQFS